LVCSEWRARLLARAATKNPAGRELIPADSQPGQPESRWIVASVQGPLAHGVPSILARGTSAVEPASALGHETDYPEGRGDTDTTRGYEYTDWVDLQTFAEDFGRRVAREASRDYAAPTGTSVA
jgi:hypothetical protein